MQQGRNKSHKGILLASAGLQHFSLNRYEPDSRLATYVEQYWIVRWDLREQAPYHQTILSFPSVNLAFELVDGQSFCGVYGVPTTTYTRQLAGTGMTLGVKFRPGGFYPFWQQPAADITDRTLPAKQLLGSSIAVTASQIFGYAEQETHNEHIASLAEQFLLARFPGDDPNVALVNNVMQHIISRRDLTRVEALADHFQTSSRTLQRLFSRYVGVSPKWAIQRFRLQEAAERMEQDDTFDWAQLADQLGFYDQAHFINSFKALVGVTPEAYIARTKAAPPTAAAPPTETGPR